MVGGLRWGRGQFWGHHQVLVSVTFGYEDGSRSAVAETAPEPAHGARHHPMVLSEPVDVRNSGQQHGHVLRAQQCSQLAVYSAVKYPHDPARFLWTTVL